MSSSLPSLPDSAQRAAPGLTRKPEADARLSPATPAGGADGTALSPPAAGRHRGVVASVKDGYGFIKCVRRVLLLWASQPALGLSGVPAGGCGTPLTASPHALAGWQVCVSRGPVVFPRQRGDVVGRVQARALAP